MTESVGLWDTLLILFLQQYFLVCACASLKVDREYQHLFSDIAPTFIAGFQITKELPYSGEGNKISKFEGFDYKMIKFPLLLTSQFQKSLFLV